ncbi:MAG: hypothetical protein CM1200mP30_22070 [Pseudomonadota bacterium]|nr:MAG: hypothetical protein CM1200mP30_22070 [Pseudomonadota bacterium]
MSCLPVQEQDWGQASNRILLWADGTDLERLDSCLCYCRNTRFSYEYHGENSSKKNGGIDLKKAGLIYWLFIICYAAQFQFSGDWMLLEVNTIYFALMPLIGVFNITFSQRGNRFDVR